MKKLLLLIITISLISCSKMPQEKYDTARKCVDSLKYLGAETSLKFVELSDKMQKADDEYLKQQTMLFKDYKYFTKLNDEIIMDARKFVITYDRINNIPLSVTNKTILNSNVVRLEVEITFEDKPDALIIANQVDEAIRRSMNSNAKLISTKVIQ
jgi:hypothetical protein